MSTIRVALASKDGVTVNQSLIEINEVYIYDIYDDANMPPVFVAHRGNNSDEEDVSESAPVPGTVDWLLSTLWDCSMLIVSDIGMAKIGRCRVHWITVHEAAMPIKKAITRLSRSSLFRQQLNWPKVPQISDCESLCK
jgi:hypothetical protein